MTKHIITFTIVFFSSVFACHSLGAESCSFSFDANQDQKLEGEFLYKRGQIAASRNIEFQDDSWSKLKVPFTWSSAIGSYRGEMWLRCHIYLTSGQHPQAAALKLRDIADVDEVFFNGIRIGQTGSFSPLLQVFSEDRIYMIPGSAWQNDNVLAIRLYGSSPFAGIKSPPVLLADAGRSGLGSTIRLQGMALAFSTLYLIFALFFVIRGMVTLRFSENLFFAAFCAMLGLYQMMRNGYRYEFFSEFPTSFAFELLLLIPLPFLFYEFLIAWTEEERPRFALYLETAAIVLWVFTAIVPFFATSFVATLLQLSMYFNLALLLSGAVLGVLMIRKIYKQQPHRLKYPTIGFVLILPFMLNDMLVTAGVIKTPNLFVFAFPAFLASFALQLARNEVDIAEITRHRNVEKKQAERRKSEAIYNVSQEFQYHFDGVRAALAKASLSEKQLKRHSSSLRQLLSDAKLLSSLEDQSYEPRQARFSIKEQVRLIVGEVQIATGNRSSRFQVELPPDQERFWTDLTLFRSCMFHLIENAALHSNGEIQISAQVVDGKLRCSVRDEGPGISQEVQHRIFDKFYRHSQAGVPGSGIGLTIVDLAVQILHGKLHFESRQEFFTHFEIELPEMQEVKA